MGPSQEQLNRGIDALAGIETGFARALAGAGYPEPRIREPGYTTLLRTIVGQQVSVAAANSIWNKLEAAFGSGCPAEGLAAAGLDRKRGAKGTRVAVRVDVGGCRIHEKKNNYRDLTTQEE